ncbi:hypothetical protein QA584_17640 [Anaerocolumna sp. AGMB13025]|uniref:hypothetical protein n=1 Tax=Anaerocolumna sp. AGMB13025 TaxID=3039116 RepID=UPI00241F2F6B|nr:hypothetical protein [Anaerocolumna sp. AGMB13025]WFR55422.1 hypothetical protein QA584_17640 [Anaerocolumna sp. AGMB13025]
MIIITTALYCEAQPLIQYYHLKKDTTVTRFQVFKNEEILLLLTGTGAMAAAISTSAICSLLSPTSKDIFLNLGICGLNKVEAPIGTVYLCNKIVDLITNRSYYPDILFSHPFKEGCLVTSPTILLGKTGDTDRFHPSFGEPIDAWQSSKNHITNLDTASFSSMQKEDINSGKGFLVDMEAAGLYPAAACFFKPHQMFFLKIVSDYLELNAITADCVTAFIQPRLPEIHTWISKIQEALRNSPSVFTEAEEEYIKEVTRSLLFSASMELKLRQLLKYYKLKTGNFTDRLNDYLTDKVLPCNTKSEGKMYFEQLRQLFI